MITVENQVRIDTSHQSSLFCIRVITKVRSGMPRYMVNAIQSVVTVLQLPNVLKNGCPDHVSTMNLVVMAIKMAIAYTNTGIEKRTAIKAATFASCVWVTPRLVAKSMKRNSNSSRPKMKRKPPMNTATRL